MDGEKKKLRLSFGYLILGLWAVLLVQQVLSAYLRPNRISYSDFKAAVAQNQVEETAIGKTLIQGRMKEGAAAPAGAHTVAAASAAAPSRRSLCNRRNRRRKRTAAARAALPSKPSASTIRIC